MSDDIKNFIKKVDEMDEISKLIDSGKIKVAGYKKEYIKKQLHVEEKKKKGITKRY